MSLDILPRDIIYIITKALSIQNILRFTVTCKYVHTVISPFISDMIICKARIWQNYSTITIIESAIPQLEKRIVHKAVVIYDKCNIMAIKTAETDDGRAFTLKLIVVTDRNILDRYVYVLDDTCWRVLIALGRSVSDSIITTARRRVSLCDMLEYIIMDFTDMKRHLITDTFVHWAATTKYSNVPTADTRPTFESVEFLRFMVGLDD